MQSYSGAVVVTAPAAGTARCHATVRDLRRDFAADWRRWSRVERIGACIAALVSAAAPLGALFVAMRPMP